MNNEFNSVFCSLFSEQTIDSQSLDTLSTQVQKRFQKSEHFNCRYKASCIMMFLLYDNYYKFFIIYPIIIILTSYNILFKVVKIK